MSVRSLSASPSIAKLIFPLVQESGDGDSDSSEDFDGNSSLGSDFFNKFAKAQKTPGNPFTSEYMTNYVKKLSQNNDIEITVLADDGDASQHHQRAIAAARPQSSDPEAQLAGGSGRNDLFESLFKT